MKTSALRGPRGTATAPLLYWLATLCGLCGITVLRGDDHVVPIWFGSIVGISLGQLIAVLRIRVWTTAVIAMFSSWIVGPAIYVSLCELFGYGIDTETALLTLAPGFICGYASLTERGGLLAFWFPAMLWMLVILDGEMAGSFAPRAYLPMIVGLGAIFVAFMRARETRRVELWRSFSTKRLAEPSPNMILRASPASGLASLVWTGAIGGGALLIAAWMAPNLFQKERANHAKLTVPPAPMHYSEDSALPCCPQNWESEKTKEYLSLRGYEETQMLAKTASCSYCPPPAPKVEYGVYASDRGAGIRAMDSGAFRYQYPADEFTYAYNDQGGISYSWNANYIPPAPQVYIPPTPAYVPPAIPEYVPPTPAYVPPVPAYVPPPVVQPKPVKPVVHPKTAKTNPAPTPVVAPKPVVIADAPKAPPPPPPPAVVKHEVTPPPVASAPEPSTPWGWLLPFFAGVVVVPMGTRFVRRRVTMRHLERPFWKEPLDQRISNHWQRMLVALRDAGIKTRLGEQPQAFAKRIKIAGMAECATILERVRHGVRVDADDLSAMETSTTAVCAAAQKRAGIAGRMAGSFRWPLV